ncbi:MAG: NAD-dependent DNA ligase LigA [Lachnospiraceae bacterium]|nr:NAD-dependent DNA ligase LigA [Lachnospiraceae bacterium]
MRELIDLLNKASKAYYAEDREIMSNYEYDALYDELVKLEESTGVVMSDSPTVNVGYESLEELPRERHDKPMLSLGKTKDREELRSWLNDKEGLLSWKLDGLTIVLTYEDGKLLKAVTRGNGEVGEVVTNNAYVFKNIPHMISFKGQLIVRGEAVIKYSDFEEINRKIPETEDKYKNPRNLCSGSVRQLSNKVTAERNVFFYAFNLVQAEGEALDVSRSAQFEFLNGLGFDVVEYHKVDKDNILQVISDYEEKIKTYDIPSDGLVLTYEDIAYGKSLGMTAKYPRDSIAFKWADEIRETTLREIEWSPSRTGLINPVAIFDPVELEGTTVSRASVHNISVLKNLKLGIGDRINVYKANMIIPQIAENLDGSDTVVIPDTCPCCGGQTEIRQLVDAKSLYCLNPECMAKQIKALSLYVSRDAMNIEGLSEATLEKFIGLGLIKKIRDIYYLKDKEEKITEIEGFGKRSFDNLIAAIDKSRETVPARFLYALGIPGIGLANAKVICSHFDDDIDRLSQAGIDELNGIQGIGEVLAGSVAVFFANKEKLELVRELREELTFRKAETVKDNVMISGKSFVITGSLNGYANRDELKAVIESMGGKVTGSVTGNTTALINNDINSSSSKNKKAKELGVEIISEEDFKLRFLDA